MQHLKDEAIMELDNMLEVYEQQMHYEEEEAIIDNHLEMEEEREHHDSLIEEMIQDYAFNETEAEDEPKHKYKSFVQSKLKKQHEHVNETKHEDDSYLDNILDMMGLHDRDFHAEHEILSQEINDEHDRIVNEMHQLIED